MVRLSTRVFVLLSALMVFIIYLETDSLGAKIDKFTADHVAIDANGNVVHRGKIYMMPDRIIPVEIIPKGNRGKTDYKKLIEKLRRT